jgi:hypothetical protein
MARGRTKPKGWPEHFLVVKHGPLLVKRGSVVVSGNWYVSASIIGHFWDDIELVDIIEGWPKANSQGFWGEAGRLGNEDAGLSTSFRSGRHDEPVGWTVEERSALRDGMIGLVPGPTRRNPANPARSGRKQR